MVKGVRGLISHWFGGMPSRGTAAREAERVPGQADASQDRNATFVAGVAAYRAGRYREAADCFLRCVESRHDDSAAHLNLGLAYQALGSFEDATDSFLLALHFRPEYAEAHFNLGVLAMTTGEIKDAEHRFRQALLLVPEYPDALNNLGYLQGRYLDQAADGENNLRRALELRPGFTDALCNLGVLLQYQGRFREASGVFDDVLRLDPGQPEAKLNRALQFLGEGAYAEGWQEYEARKLVGSGYPPPGLTYPAWEGTPLPHATVLVYGEQGLGDEIMFASCVPDVVALCRTCVILCAPKLEPVFRRSFPAAVVRALPQPDEATTRLVDGVPEIDCQIAIGSLPLHFRRDRSAFPTRTGYLVADAERRHAWRARLEALGSGMKVGIAWRGGTVHTRMETRSTRLTDWLPILATPWAHWISLQHTKCGDEIERFRQETGIRVYHWQDAIDDYDETIALADALDLVISVQTAAVHMAGALGRPTWALISAAPEWRYLHTGTTMPWYPSVRLYRQASLGDWSPVVGRVRGDLERFIGARSGRTPTA